MTRKLYRFKGKATSVEGKDAMSACRATVQEEGKNIYKKKRVRGRGGGDRTAYQQLEGRKGSALWKSSIVKTIENRKGRIDGDVVCREKGGEKYV